MECPLPYVITLPQRTDVRSWIRSNQVLLSVTLDRLGALLLRQEQVVTESGFKELVAAFSQHPLDYVYRSTPRTSLGSGIYTATEFPAGLTIPQHSENSYQSEWPLYLLFFCECPAVGTGGQTSLARLSNVTNRIDCSIRQRFAAKKVAYIRNYNKNLDLPWQIVFQTESRSQVEEFCYAHNIEFEWRGECLRTRQVCQALARHPRTGAIVWFNQAHLFHPSSLDERTRATMRQLFAADDFPRNATYGDGTPLDEPELDHIRRAFNDEIVTFQWRSGDVLILDNMQISHGRTPYKGARRVLVAMCERISAEASS
jgi:hypothetical protein